MTIYTTPLQLGYFFALLMALIFWVRSYREQRLSDFFLGSLFLLLALELQDYTFGFAGINVLWEELNGFPRNVSLLIGPTLYFYLQTQTNRLFQLKKKQLLHLIPFGVYFITELFVFAQGKYAVQQFQQSQLSQALYYLNWFVMIVSYSFYFYKSLCLYNAYRTWTEQHYSNTELISFKWFRNFIYVLIACFASKELFHLIDFILVLNFNQDWWWNLIIVAAVFYIGLTAYSQRQPVLLSFNIEPSPLPEPTIATETPNHDILYAKLDRIMKEDRLYLQAELSLSELAKHLKVNNNQLSACINQLHQKNFNDYINGLRVEEFERRIQQEDAQQYTLLAIAFDCGFNSKTTFNRAFKKEKGQTPKQFISNNKLD